MLIATICIYRSIAVAFPLRYKALARYSIIVKLAIVLLVISLVGPCSMIISGAISYKYIGVPEYIGCTVVLQQNSYFIYLVITLLMLFVANLVLLITYILLNNAFKALITRPAIKMMKEGALRITMSIALGYLAGYSLTFVVYCIQTTRPGLLGSLKPPYKLILDFCIQLFPHVYESLLPVFLVASGTMRELRKASHASTSIRLGIDYQ